MVRRRANGEGTVNERGDGRWEARWTDNQGQRRSAYGKTQREALRAMREARDREGLGLAPLGRDSTVERFLGDFLEQHIGPNREPWTYAGYRGLIRNHFVPALGHYRLDQVTPAVVQAFVASLRAGGMAPSTVHKARQRLSTAFAWAVGMRLIAENPVTPVRTPKGAHRVDKGAMMTEEEVTAFCRVIRGDRDEGVYLLGLLLGLRIGEVMGLSWDHVDLQAHEARIVQQVQRVTGRGMVVKPLKTGRAGARVVPLPLRLVEALWARRLVEAQDRERAWTTWREDFDRHRLVFRSRQGTPLEQNEVRRRFLALLAQIDLPPRRFHDLRHNCATILFGRGVSAKLVQELLGHTNIGITLDLYTHVPKGAMRTAVAEMERLLED